MKILLADDDTDQLEVRGLLLEHSGFEAIPASDAAAALRAAREERPECAVVDLKFPTEEAGWALIRALKAMDAGMRVILLTGADPRKLALLPEHELIDEVMLKGASAARLIETLRSLAASLQHGPLQGF